MSAVMVSAEHVGKRYRLRHRHNADQYLTLRDSIAAGVSAPFRWLSGTRTPATTTDDFWALNDVSFRITSGEVVGIIGRNGAGKSTLLKILSRITDPTSGRVTLGGRVASLLEVGTGFHPELSGRENIFLNAAILGMSRAETARKFDAIVAFAEVERFLDTPVKRYSSGMYVRLAFAVAAHLEPEILVVDEVLAVGDADFQKRCLGKIAEVSQGGRTVLFVSHNMSAIQTLCPRALWIDRGRIVRDDRVGEVVRDYLSAGVSRGDADPVHWKVSESIDVAALTMTPNPVESGAPVAFTIALHARSAARISELTLLFQSTLELRIAIVDLRERLPVSIAAGETWTVRGRIRSLPFVEGDYAVGLGIGSQDFFGNRTGLTSLRVVARPALNGVVPHRAEYRGFVELETEVASE